MTPQTPFQVSGATSLVEKIEGLRRGVQDLVLKGIENPRLELTRECSLAGQDKESQADFAKTIQGMANALPAEERIYVVGADQRGKRFLPLTNPREFDPANLQSVLGKLLEPVPVFDAHVLKANDDSPFAVIILPADQPRPIFAKVDVQRPNGNSHVLRRGEVWIKKNTANTPATREDIDRMYQDRAEVEAERRAQVRVSHYREGMEANLRLHSSPERRTPSEDLIFGRDVDFRAYVEQLLANDDYRRFRMLLTIMRDLLIERWHATGAFEAQHSAQFADEFEPKVREHIRDAVIPSLRAVAYTWLLLAKYDLGPAQDPKWIEETADLLVDAFGACATLAKLPDRPVRTATGTPPSSAEFRDTALAVMLDARVLAAYALRAKRYHLVPSLLKKYVNPVVERRSDQEPLLFWPVRGVVVPGENRVAYTWDRIAQGFCPQILPSKGWFIESASQLEFVLHMNSYVAANDEAVKQRFSRESRSPYFLQAYWRSSDLWRYPMEPVVPLAEEFYKSLGIGRQSRLLLDLSAEPTILQTGLYGPDSATLNRAEAQARFIQYLKALERWRAEAASNAKRFPQETDWGSLLGPLISASDA